MDNKLNLGDDGGTMKTLSDIFLLSVMIVMGVVCALIVAWSIFASVAGVEKLAGRMLTFNELAAAYCFFSVLVLTSTFIKLFQKNRR